MNGVYKAFHNNGQLWKEVNYINDKKEGVEKIYSKDGQLIDTCNYQYEL
jgi:antitoxin component YwqK of YwqJK toxin-antitoxin module